MKHQFRSRRILRGSIVGSACSAVMIAISGANLTANVSFSDVPLTHPYYTEIMQMRSTGVLEGYEDGSFRPYLPVTRAGFATITLRSFIENTEAQECAASAPANLFTDIGDLSKDWFGPWVCEAWQMGVSSGYPDGSFQPDRNITAAEMAKMVAVAFNIAVRPEVSGESWYMPYLHALIGNNLWPPSLTSADQLVSRADVAWVTAHSLTHREKSHQAAQQPVQQAAPSVQPVAKAQPKKITSYTSAIRQLQSKGTYEGTTASELAEMRERAEPTRAKTAQEETQYTLTAAPTARPQQNSNTRSGSSSSSSQAQSQSSSQSSELPANGDVGSLFVTLDSTPLRDRQLLGGALGEAILRVQFHAEVDAVDVTDLQFSLFGKSNEGSVDRLELYKIGETESFAYATIGGCGSDQIPEFDPDGNTSPGTFCANMEAEQLLVAAGEAVDILVKPKLKSDLQGAISGDTIQLFISDQRIASASAGAVRARDRETGEMLFANNEDSEMEAEIFIGTATTGPNNFIVGNEHDIVLAKIADIANASPDQNRSAIPTGISDIGKFLFSAAPNSNNGDGMNDAVIDALVLDVQAVHVGLSQYSFKIYNRENNSDANKHPCMAVGSNGSNAGDGTMVTGSFFVRCDGLSSSFAIDTEIDSGQELVLVLEAEVANTNTTGNTETSTLQVSLQKFNNRDSMSVGVYEGDSHISWFDRDIDSDMQYYWVEHPKNTIKSTSYAE